MTNFSIDVIYMCVCVDDYDNTDIDTQQGQRIL